MISYTDLENELIGKLNAYFTANSLVTLLAIPVPQNESEVKRGLNLNRIWVGYAGSNYDHVQSLETVVQDEDIAIRFVFAGQSLRETDGIYAMIFHLKTCLLGYQPTGCSQKMWLGKYEDVEYENLGIIKSLVMHTSTPNIGVQQPQEVFGTEFKKATYL